jgi:hypothetical protein
MGIAEAEGIDTRENRAFAFIPSLKLEDSPQWENYPLFLRFFFFVNRPEER